MVSLCLFFVSAPFAHAQDIWQGNAGVAAACADVIGVMDQVRGLSGLKSSGDTGRATQLLSDILSANGAAFRLADITLGNAAAKVYASPPEGGETVVSFIVDCVKDFKCRRDRLDFALSVFSAELQTACKADFLGK